jgi:16S rRNA (cytosine1402-N4)-methyltransferase
LIAMKSEYHHPVLLQTCIENLNIRPDGIYADATLGGGGHTEAILRQNDSCRVIALDADRDALLESSKRLASFGSRVIMEQSNFRNLKQILMKHHIACVHGLLLDLGVSSYQLDQSDKGFSYRFDAPLKMQMNDHESFSAYEIVNRYDEKELAEIFYRLGEEKNSRRIAKKIIESRMNKPIETTLQLAGIIAGTIPDRFAKKTLSRIFQALRIAVNDELNNLRKILEDAPAVLLPEGRLAVISYHSLEDRIVKDFLRYEAADHIADENFPEFTISKKPRFRLVHRKAIRPAEEEILNNPRARSAKLRLAERI